MAEVWPARSKNVKKEQQNAKRRMEPRVASHDVFLSTTTNNARHATPIMYGKTFTVGQSSQTRF